MIMLKRKIKENIKKLAIYSTAYGIPNYLRSKRIYNKILWLLFIITSSCTSSYYVYDAIVEYFDNKVVTQIKTKYEQPLRFPAVTICSYEKDSFINKTLEELILNCTFDNELFNKNFFETIDTTIGKCIRFNTGNNMSLVLNSTFGGLDDSFSCSIMALDGLNIWIHDQTAPPKLSYKNNHYGNRILASSGFYTQIVIDKVVQQQLSFPFNDCYDDITLFKYNKTIIDFIFKNREVYSRNRCYELCFELDYLEKKKCNCLVNLGNVWDYCWQIVENKEYDTCTWLHKQRFYKKNIIDKCVQYCPIECKTSSYLFEISSLAIKSNFTRFKIYYRELKYTHITQEPKVILINLIANVGGAFSLFIGLSFISIFELIEIFIEILFIFLSHYKVNLI